MHASRKELQDKDDKMRGRNEAWLEEVFKSGGLWTSREEMDQSLKGYGKGKTRTALSAQINVHVRILKRELPGQPKVFLTKSSIDELKAHVVALMAVTVTEGLDDLYELIQSPQSLTGQHFVQQWVENEVRKWFEGVFESFLKETDEFKMSYPH